MFWHDIPKQKGFRNVDYFQVYFITQLKKNYAQWIVTRVNWLFVGRHLRYCSPEVTRVPQEHSVKVTPEQATKAQTGRRGTAL